MTVEIRIPLHRSSRVTRPRGSTRSPGNIRRLWVNIRPRTWIRRRRTAAIR